MKTNNKTMNAIRPMGAGLLAVAMGAALALTGCTTGGGSSSVTSTAAWPSAPPPATTQKNTYVGTQSPGWYSVTIDHTTNIFSYQDLSTSAATVSGTFMTTANGFLRLSSGGYVLEQLSRAVLLVPAPTASGKIPFTDNAVFAVAAPSCQTIPSRTKFAYIASPSPYYGIYNGGVGTPAALVDAGMVYASTDTNGANWTFGGQLEFSSVSAASSGVPSTPFSPTPDPFIATCASSSDSAVIQTEITVPNSLAGNSAVGPTGFFVEDRYQSDNAAFIGSVEPSSPVDLSGLTGTTFLGINGGGGVASANSPSLSNPQLIAVSAAPDSTGKSIVLTGGYYPSNDLSQAPVSNFRINLGAQDVSNNGFFPAATYTCTSPSCVSTANPAFAVVSNAGGKYTIFVQSGSGLSLLASSWILFQQ